MLGGGGDTHFTYSESEALKDSPPRWPKRDPEHENSISRSCRAGVAKAQNSSRSLEG